MITNANLWRASAIEIQAAIEAANQHGLGKKKEPMPPYILEDLFIAQRRRLRLDANTDDVQDVVNVHHPLHPSQLNWTGWRFNDLLNVWVNA